MNATSTEKKIALLGSTGSIGTQALDVIRQNPDKFKVEVLTAYSNDELLLKQALEFRPNVVVIADESKYEALSERLWEEGIKTYCGEKSLEDVVQMDEVDLVLTALVGYSGLKTNHCCYKSKKAYSISQQRNIGRSGRPHNYFSESIPRSFTPS